MSSPIRHRRRYLVLALVAWLASWFVAGWGSFVNATPIPPWAVSLSQAADSAQTLEQRGRVRYQAGDFAAAAQAWGEAAEDYGRSGDRPAQTRVLSNLALAYLALNQGLQAETAITQALQGVDPQTEPALQAQVWSTQARLLLAQGNGETALERWQAAVQAYGQAGDDSGQIRAQLGQAEALEQLGFYERARLQLERLLERQLQTSPNLSPNLQVWAMLRLGALHRVSGSLSRSEQLFQQALSLTQQSQLPDLAPVIQLELGKTAQAQQQWEKAIASYDQALDLITHDLALQLEGERLRIEVFLAQQNWEAAQQATSRLTALLESSVSLDPLDPSAAIAQSLPLRQQLDLAQTLLHLQKQAIRQKAIQRQTQFETLLKMLLEAALGQARSLGDRRHQSYALGMLGELAEQQQRWDLAQAHSQTALQLAQQLNASELSYRWEWQLGRILQHRGQAGDAALALRFSRDAVQTLNGIQSDILKLNPDVQFSFETDVAPVYQQYVDLQLRAVRAIADKIADPDPGRDRQAALQIVQQTLDQRRFSEFSTFLGEPCSLSAIPSGPVSTGQAPQQPDPRAALITPIPLADRVEILLQLPDGKLQQFTTPIAADEFHRLLQDFRYYLVVRSRKNYLPLAQRLYDLLIRPLESQLADHQIATLVFSLDSTLNTIPMAALHDGQRFLLETYGVALTPRLERMQPSPLSDRQFQTLAVGLSEAREGFSPLDSVTQEIEAIAHHTHRSTVLLDQQFTQAALRDRMHEQSFPVVHIATHGQFSSNPDDTFLLAWDQTISVQALDEMVRSRSLNTSAPIELLVLSACKTAVGDDRAALGMAGVAIRAGARSTLATLWSIDDSATAQLMDTFYAALGQSGISRAEALRQAQLKLLANPAYQHPIFWSPYILLGNWL